MSPRAASADLGRDALLEHYEGDAGPALALIEATAELMAPSPIHTVPRLRRWHSARMVVLGDAAHAPSPSSGQGASLSIEDALVLATCLRDARDPETAFPRFEAARRPRVERIVKWAARMNSSKAAGPVGRVVRDAMLPAILKLTADSRAARAIYEYRVEGDAPALARA